MHLVFTHFVLLEFAYVKKSRSIYFFFFCMNRQLTMEPALRDYQSEPRFDQEFYIPVTESSANNGNHANSFINRHSHLQQLVGAVSGQNIIQPSNVPSNVSQTQLSRNQTQKSQLVMDQQQQQFLLDSTLQQSQRGESAFERLAAGAKYIGSQNTTTIPVMQSQRPTQRHLNQDLMSLASPLTVASHQLMLQQQTTNSNGNPAIYSDGETTRYSELFEQAKQQRLQTMQSLLATTGIDSQQQQQSSSVSNANAVPLRGAPNDLWALRAQTLKSTTTPSQYVAAVAGSGHFSSTNATAQVAAPSQHMQGSVMFLNNMSAQEHQRKYREQQEKQKQSRVGWKSYSDYRNA